MSVSITFNFISGRYHATPFGHHVNEGLVEWPPSPWRLLRALISVGYTSGVWNGSGPSSLARGLIYNLASELPGYDLPKGVSNHSRHYMPIGELRPDKIEKTTLGIDTWLRVTRHLTVTWSDLVLDNAEISLLNTLVSNMNYLGRSESWVAGKVITADDISPCINCHAERPGDLPRFGWEQVSLLAPLPYIDYEDWRQNELRSNSAQLYPKDLLDCLQKSTSWLRQRGWSQPPGSRRVLYYRKTDSINTSAPPLKPPATFQPSVKAMLLSVNDSSRSDGSLPTVYRTLPQAELLHRKLVGISLHYKELPAELVGKDASHAPLQDSHRHAHINPLDLDGDQRIDHILIWAPKGLGPSAQSVVRSVRNVPTKGRDEPLRLALAAVGELHDLPKLPEPYGRYAASLVLESSTWQSYTPFVPARYIKRHGKNTLEGQVCFELVSRGFPKPVNVRVLAPAHYSRSRPNDNLTYESAAQDWSVFRHFKIERRHKPRPPIVCGFAIRLEFADPVSGPIALGYGSHFGLGLFEACK